MFVLMTIVLREKCIEEKSFEKQSDTESWPCNILLRKESMEEHVTVSVS